MRGKIARKDTISHMKIAVAVAKNGLRGIFRAYYGELYAGGVEFLPLFPYFCTAKAKTASGMKLLLMTTPDFFVEEHQILTALFDEGLDILHLRKPHTEPVYSERLLSLLPEEYRNRIVVHDHYYLKNEYRLRGIHLNPRNEPPQKFKGTVSASATTLSDVQRLKRNVDYVLFTPQMETPGLDARHSDRQIDEWGATKTIDSKVMLMGGVTLDNVGRAKRAGFGGVVLYGAIWNRFDQWGTPDFKDLTGYFRKIKKLC